LTKPGLTLNCSAISVTVRWPCSYGRRILLARGYTQSQSAIGGREVEMQIGETEVTLRREDLQRLRDFTQSEQWLTSRSRPTHTAAAAASTFIITNK
jgi:hypothetical protein